MNTKISTAFLLLFFVVCFSSCLTDDELNEVKYLPVTVQTSSATSITSNSAKLGGIITAPQARRNVTRGICWSTTENPDVSLSTKTVDGTGIGSFSSTLTGLQPATTYYVKAYATIKIGTVYGSQQTFKTASAAASLTTSIVTAITTTTATCGGAITSDGGATITVSGVCWSTTANPTTANSKTTDGLSASLFTSSITGLTPGITYYVRAYATNSVGTAYGNQQTFATTSTLGSLTTSLVTAITTTTASCGGTITTNGGSTITVSGVCWSTSENPTTADSKTTDGSTLGSFTSALTGLSPGTQYFVRAYATNSVGTAYGNQQTFQTLTATSIASLTTSNVTDIATNSATCGGTITSDGGATITASGVCWSSSSNPTTTNSKTTDGSTSGSFTSSIIGLLSGTTYYVRSYATNGAGTAYGNQVSFSTTESSGTVADIDGNVYHTVTIGTQVWMVENLKSTKYNDGTSIPLVSVSTAWSILTTPAYCWYNNDAANKNVYGALYNWHTVNTNKLAPTGWHVPTDAEWTTLENYLIANGYNYDGITSGNKIAKSLASTTNWFLNSGIGCIGNDLTKNNTSGFSALPGGYRTTNGAFNSIGGDGYWWSSTNYSTSGAWARYLYYDGNNLNRSGNTKIYGFSVRCLQD